MFSFDDYNAMLALQCKKDEHESSELNAYLIDLHAVAMEVEVEGWAMDM
jgi:hypothetical protein